MVAKFSVRKSSFGDLRGVEQYVMSERIALQVLSTIIDFNAYLRSKGRSGTLSVNEGMRSRPRQSYLWNNRAALGVVVAPPFTSRHDEVLHGNAIDFGITMPDGSNRALYDDEFARLHQIVEGRGGTWPDWAKTAPEPWHHEYATRTEAVPPYPDARARLAAKPAASTTVPAKPAAPVKPPTPKVEADMLYVTSEKTKKQYAIGELTFTPVSSSRAITYSHAVPGETSLFQTLTSAQVSGLIQDCRDRRDSLGVAISAKFESAVKAALAEEDAA
ncbi:hypothetical protein DEJ17_06515 [Curtobacterium sp. MCSS17_011]|uniref:hypothetical protein n=1 Tax=Curtobacterium sp. MCSS17_011 TaxID=2175643 RepID=UPI000D96AB6A|nr:hypothetical protein [Curtobacterium sp. MCSS17_011]PYY60019.1 hypothetical protein DEJ17_06515 [Curtobacterium sp. MCSS17_011]